MRTVGIYSTPPKALPFPGALFVAAGENVVVLSEQPANHQEMIACFRAGDFLPLPQVEGSPAQLVDRVARMGPAIDESFRALRGKVEIAVVLSPESTLLLPPSSPFIPVKTEEPSSGQAFLRRLKRERDETAARAEAINSAALQAAAFAAKRNIAFRRHPMRNGAVLIALLAPRSDAARIADEITAIDMPGCKLDVSGPWPPYSFTPSLPEAPPC
jgi:hypothetical protein